MGGMQGMGMGQQQPGAGGQAQANPFAGMGMGGLGGMDPAMMQAMMGGQAQAQPNAAADTRPPREKYADQLKQIKEMGFNDEEAIL